MANLVVLTGRLTRDPELRYTQGGSAVCTFTLAVDRGLSRQKKQEAEASGKPTADFIRITIFGRQAENAYRYLKKGSQCLVEGRIQTGSYDDKDTGKKIFTTDVIADRVEFLDGPNQAQNNAQANNYNSAYNSTGSNGKNDTEQNKDDFFDDDFTEISDDGFIPF